MTGASPSAAPSQLAAPPRQPQPRSAGPSARRVFGLGTSEILVILAVGAFLLGPETLKGFAKEAGKAAGDLKDVPEAFQAGMEEKTPKLEEGKEKEGAKE